MRIVQLAIASVILLVLAASANASILTFEDIPGGSIQGSAGNMPTYQGFNFSATLDWWDLVGSSWNYGAHSGDFALLNNHGGIGIVTDAGGADFTFDGLWAKAWATQPESGGADALFGVLEGYNNGSLVWSVNTSLNGSYEFYGPQAGAIDQLNLGFGNFFLVDDIALNMPTATTPEPASCVIWGTLGIAGLVAARRRKKLAA